MRKHTGWLSLLPVTVLALGCTNSSGSSSSSGGTSGGTPSSSGSVVSGSSVAGASSAAQDSSASVAGSSAASGVSHPASSRASSRASGSSSAPSCHVDEVTLCNGVAVTNSEGVIINTHANPGPMGFGAPININLGMTRTAVTAAITDAERLAPGTGGGASPTPFTVYYCSRGISVSYADTPDANQNLAGTLTNDDVVVRISTLPGFAGHTDTALALGSTAAAVETAHGTSNRAQVSDNVLGGAQDLYPKAGLAFGYTLDHVTMMAVHQPYNGTILPTAANALLTLQSLKMGSGNSEVRAAATNGTNLALVKAALGQPDTQGFADANGQTIAYLSYGSAGIRVLGLKGNATNVDDVATFQVVLSPPFAGIDGSNGLGLGAPRAGWAAAYEDQGTATLAGATVQKYKVGANGLFDVVVAVAFAQDRACVDRAAGILLNFFQL